jgi:hypothetical protein
MMAKPKKAKKPSLREGLDRLHSRVSELEYKYGEIHNLMELEKTVDAELGQRVERVKQKLLEAAQS